MKLLSITTKKIVACILMTLLVWITCTPKTTIATENVAGNTGMTEEQVRDNFVNQVLTFASQHGQQCTYHVEGREDTYVAGPEAGSYIFDCVGWVSCAIHWFLGLGGARFDYFVEPTANHDTDVTSDYIHDSTHYQRVNDISQAKKGDILVYKSSYKGETPYHDGHVAIYIGDGKIVDMQNIVAIRDISERPWDFVAHLYNFEGVTFDPIQGGANLGGTITADEIDLDVIADQFVFDGMPPTVIYQDQKIDVFRWLFDTISGFMDFVAGLIISIIKAPILGFAGMFDNFIDSFFTGMN